MALGRSPSLCILLLLLTVAVHKLQAVNADKATTANQGLSTAIGERPGSEQQPSSLQGSAIAGQSSSVDSTVSGSGPDSRTRLRKPKTRAASSAAARAGAAAGVKVYKRLGARGGQGPRVDISKVKSLDGKQKQQQRLPLKGLATAIPGGTTGVLRKRVRPENVAERGRDGKMASSATRAVAVMPAGDAVTTGATAAATAVAASGGRRSAKAVAAAGTASGGAVAVGRKVRYQRPHSALMAQSLVFLNAVEHWQQSASRRRRGHGAARRLRGGANGAANSGAAIGGGALAAPTTPSAKGRSQSRGRSRPNVA